MSVDLEKAALGKREWTQRQTAFADDDEDDAMLMQVADQIEQQQQS